MALETDTDSSPEPAYQIRPVSDVLGAEVIGLDLSAPVSAATRDAIYDAFVHYQVLVFRDQALTKPQQIAFSEQFGTLERHTPRNRGRDGFPQVHVVNNLDEHGRPRGSLDSTLWHSDKAFRREPSSVTMLHAVTLPPEGGDTCFANLYLAYEALAEAEKQALEDVRVVHSIELSRENIGRRFTEEEKRDAESMSHFLVRSHPDSGRKCLFIGMHAAFIEGMAFEDGQARLEALEAFATQPQFVYRHHWRAGDFLMWDNRCLMHRADPNFDAARYPRVLHRTCLKGATPEGSWPVDVSALAAALC